MNFGIHCPFYLVLFISQVQGVIISCQFLTGQPEHWLLCGFFFPNRSGKNGQLCFFSFANRSRAIRNQPINSPSDFQGHTCIYMFSEFVQANSKTKVMFSRGRKKVFDSVGYYAVRTSKKTLRSPLHKLSRNLQITSEVNYLASFNRLLLHV